MSHPTAPDLSAMRTRRRFPPPIDSLRMSLVVIAAVAQTVLAYLPVLSDWESTVASKATALSNPLLPAGFTFIIWGIVFFRCLMFAGWQLAPVRWEDPFLRRIGWSVAAIFALNAFWETYVPLNDLDWLSLGVMTTMTVLLTELAFRLRSHREAMREPIAFWLMTALFHFFAGWVIVAVFVNLGTTLVRAEPNGFDVREPTTAMLLLGVCGLLANLMAALLRSWNFVVAAAWAFFGIISANRAADRTEVAAVAIGCFVSLFIVTFFARRWFPVCLEGDNEREA